MTSAYGKLTLSYKVGSYEQKLVFGAVTDLDISYNKSVMTTPIVSRSVRNTFALETASSITVTVEFARTEADEIETGMLNAAWDATLVGMMDRWQAKTNGFRLRYEPNNAIDGGGNPYIAAFDYNGFMRDITTRYEHGMTQYLTGSFTFEVGTMYVSRR